MRSLLVVAALVFVVAACGGGSSGDDVGDDDAPAPDANPAGWQTLVTSSWTIPMGEQYLCERKTIENDVWIRAFDGQIPLGHHHAVLTVNETPNGADGQYSCDAGDNSPAMIYGNAPGVEPIAFPEGVAVMVPAGSQLNLNLHLFNTTVNDISGTSDVLIQTIDPSDVVNEAEIVLMGPVGFAVPTGESEVSGGCTTTAPSTLFMMTPHMHKLGVHALVNATRAAGNVELHNDEYSFDSQTFYDLGLVAMATGDRVDITCSYINDGAPTTFGQSTNQEMCFASTYRYPKLGGNFGIVCSN